LVLNLSHHPVTNVANGVVAVNTIPVPGNTVKKPI